MEYKTKNCIFSNFNYLSTIDYIPNRLENFNRKLNINQEEQKNIFLENRLNHNLTLRKEKKFMDLAKRRGYLEKLIEDENSLNKENKTEIFHLFYINQKCREHIENQNYDFNLLFDINKSIYPSPSNSLDFENFNYIFFFLIEILTCKKLSSILLKNNSDENDYSKEFYEILKNLNILINISSFALGDYINSNEGIQSIERLYPILKKLSIIHLDNKLEQNKLTDWNRIKLENIIFISNVVSLCESNLHERFIEEFIILYRDYFLLSFTNFKKELETEILFLFSNLSCNNIYHFKEIDILDLTMQIMEHSSSGKVLLRCFHVIKTILRENKSELQRIYFHYTFLTPKIFIILDKLKTVNFSLENIYFLILAYSLNLLQQFISDSSIRPYLLEKHSDINYKILDSLMFSFSGLDFIRYEIIHTLLLLIDDTPDSIIIFNSEYINRLIDILIDCSLSKDLSSTQCLNDLISIFHLILKDDNCEGASILYSSGVFIDNIFELIEKESNILGKTYMLNQLLIIFLKLLIYDEKIDNSTYLLILLEKKEIENVFSRIYNYNQNIHIKHSADKILKILDKVKHDQNKIYI